MVNEVILYRWGKVERQRRLRWVESLEMGVTVGFRKR